MSFWDSTQQKIIGFKPQDCPQYPGWQEIDCGCSGGLKWGGEEPVECNTCQGGGIIYKHKASGALALYPGGPFCGVA